MCFAFDVLNLLKYLLFNVLMFKPYLTAGCSKVWGQIFFKEINTFIQHGHIKLAKSVSKDFL